MKERLFNSKQFSSKTMVMVEGYNYSRKYFGGVLHGSLSVNRTYLASKLKPM